MWHGMLYDIQRTLARAKLEFLVPVDTHKYYVCAHTPNCVQK